MTNSEDDTQNITAISTVAKFLDQYISKQDSAPPLAPEDLGDDEQLKSHAFSFDLYRIISEQHQNALDAAIDKIAVYLLAHGAAETIEDADNIAMAAARLMAQQLGIPLEAGESIPRFANVHANYQEPFESNNPTLNDAVSRLRNSDFKHDLYRDEGFDSSSLDTNKKLLGIALLSEIYANHQLAGIESFLTWAIRPQGTFHAQNSRVKAFPEDIKPTIEHMVKMQQYKNDRSVADASEHRSIQRQTSIQSISPMDMAMRMSLSMNGITPSHVVCHQPPKVISEWDMTRAATILLEDYLFPQNESEKSPAKTFAERHIQPTNLSRLI